ncbi:TetR/AcrR family transcriptional regulator [Prauserella flavalba]|uniref:TetR family transcriptional regulator n=1 Tax=Prauserella flavalba TaxID=1477506 RepID=A0A318LZ19_9PSEU|nr:TetR/AcrR family transcriptional regulator [Prauserella flavalba]PXY35525.1 TetR family transcriptional regulator [Prauserella flavalba]
MAEDPRKRIELLWGASGRPSRGPKPKLTLEEIVATGIRVADEEGLDALSMQRVAKELGFTTMSLYRYVPSKDRLVEVMLDRAADGPPVFTGEVVDWRGEIEAWVRGLWAMYRLHPWALEARVSAPPIGPGQLAWFEAALRPLTHAGLTGGELISTVMFLLGAVRELAGISFGLEQSRARAGISAAESEAGYDAVLREFADPGRFPSLAKLVGEGAFAPSGLDDEAVDLDLDFGVQRVLDGVEAYVAARRG